VTTIQIFLRANRSAQEKSGYVRHQLFRLQCQFPAVDEEDDLGIFREKGLNDDEAVYLANKLNHNKLKHAVRDALRLDLSDNSIGDRGAVAQAKVLTLDQTIQSFRPASALWRRNNNNKQSPTNYSARL